MPVAAPPISLLHNNVASSSSSSCANNSSPHSLEICRVAPPPSPPPPTTTQSITTHSPSPARPIATTPLSKSLSPSLSTLHHRHDEIIPRPEPRSPDPTPPRRLSTHSHHKSGDELRFNILDSNIDEKTTERVVVAQGNSNGDVHFSRRTWSKTSPKK
jgi:hypothetical protein